ncbi:MAG: DUF1566 domain-containing protein [Burkholderiales bacterium]|nr:DUF1566 domain-containing protein [Burkholderiales bacterium]
MKHKLMPLLAAGFLGASAAQASLTGNGNGLVYDNVANLTWLQDANLFGTMSAADPSLVSKIIAAVPSVVNMSNIYSPSGVYTLSSADFGQGGLLDWFGGKAWVGYLNSINYRGYNAWSLPAADPSCGVSFNCTNSQLGSLFASLGGVAGKSIATVHNAGYSLFRNVQSSLYWSGTEYASSPDNAWVFDNGNGNQSANTKTNQYYAWWAVLPGNFSAPTMAVVPEPGQWALMLAGFALMGAIARRGKR